MTDLMEGESPSVWERLRRRKVVQWGFVYAAAGWGFLQGLQYVSDAFQWPHAIRQVALLSVLLGLPVVLVVSWYYGDRLTRFFQPLLPPPPSIESTVNVSLATRSTPVPIPEKSVAVLPFADLSAEKNQEHFSDGLAEALIDLLTQVPDLRVPARTSSFFFKGRADDVRSIAERLRVAYLLEGSVRMANSTFKVTAHLIRADNGYHVWSKTFERDIKDIFKVQDEIARETVEELKARLVSTRQIAAHRTSSTEAYNAYLLGRSLSKSQNTESLKRAIEFYRKAIASDPAYAAAYAGLANAQASFADATGDADSSRRVQAAADAGRAVELAPDLADGYAARGMVRRDLEWDWGGARADFEKALALNPNDTITLAQYSWLLATLGELQEAIATARNAIQLDPLSEFAWMTLGGVLTYGRNWTAAEEALLRALEIDPHSPYSQLFLCEAQLLGGRAVEALATARLIKVDGFRLPHVAMAEHALGHAQESQEALDEAIAHHSEAFSYPIALAFAMRGATDQALEWLERAYSQRDISIWIVMVDPLLDSVRKEPRFKELLRKMKLPQ